MTNKSLLLLLQHGDSFFPGGSVSFSWGLETLCADGRVTTARDVARFLEGQLRHRWAPMDRAFLAAAHWTGDDLGLVREADRQLEAMTLSKELREGSRAAGKALLNVHEKLGTPLAGPYRRDVLEGGGCGHLAVVQGLLFQNLGLDLSSALIVSAHTTCIGILGAAVRLGRIGAMDGQSILSDLHPVIGDLIKSPIPPLEETGALTPQTEIALMRHETQEVRLFSN